MREIRLPEKYEAERSQVIIKRKPGSTISGVDSESISSYRVIKKIKPLGIEVIDVPEGKTVEAFIKELYLDSSLEFAEPNYLRKISLADETFFPNYVPNLTDYLKTNLLKESSVISRVLSTKDPDRKLQYGLDKINADKAWPITSGSENVVIAVLDSGVDLNHPDLKKNLTRGFTAINGTNSANDDNGHGTHVAGIIGAAANNQGGIGLAPECKIMPVKVLAAKGSGTDSDIAEGVIWAVDHGAKVINLSLGGEGAGKTLENAMKYAYNNNVLVVAAMGNNGSRLKTYPAGYNNIVAVGATDINNKVTSFSNFGDWISVSAPGLKIHSTFPTYKVELNRYNLTNGYASLSGTSMATPYVSALAGLLISQNAQIKRADIRKRIENTANDIDQTNFDDFSGFGIIDAYKALRRE